LSLTPPAIHFSFEWFNQVVSREKPNNCAHLASLVYRKELSLCHGSWVLASTQMWPPQSTCYPIEASDRSIPVVYDVLQKEYHFYTANNSAIILPIPAQNYTQ
jgi:hypothetical protein